jgi:hypothetical protein
VSWRVRLFGSETLVVLARPAASLVAAAEGRGGRRRDRCARERRPCPPPLAADPRAAASVASVSLEEPRQAAAFLGHADAAVAASRVPPPLVKEKLFRSRVAPHRRTSFCPASVICQMRLSFVPVTPSVRRRQHLQHIRTGRRRFVGLTIFTITVT